MHTLSRSKSASDEAGSSTSPRFGKGRRGRLAALRDEMSEKANSPVPDSPKSADKAEHIKFEDDPLLPHVSEAAKKELRDRLLRALITPLVPPDFHMHQVVEAGHASECCLEDQEQRSSESDASLAVLEARVDALDSQSVELKGLATAMEKDSTCAEQQADAAAAQTAVFVSQAETFSLEILKMSRIIEKLQVENRDLRQTAGSSQDASDGNGGGGTEEEVAQIRARNEQLEVEIKQIKSNNVRSMQKLMKELQSKDKLLKEHGIGLASK